MDSQVIDSTCRQNNLLSIRILTEEKMTLPKICDKYRRILNRWNSVWVCSLRAGCLARFVFLLPDWYIQQIGIELAWVPICSAQNARRRKHSQPAKYCITASVECGGSAIGCCEHVRNQRNAIWSSYSHARFPMFTRRQQFYICLSSQGAQHKNQFRLGEFNSRCDSPAKWYFLSIRLDAKYRNKKRKRCVYSDYFGTTLDTSRQFQMKFDTTNAWRGERKSGMKRAAVGASCSIGWR